MHPRLFLTNAVQLPYRAAWSPDDHQSLAAGIPPDSAAHTQAGPPVPGSPHPQRELQRGWRQAQAPQVPQKDSDLQSRKMLLATTVSATHLCPPCGKLSSLFCSGDVKAWVAAWSRGNKQPQIRSIAVLEVLVL